MVAVPAAVVELWPREAPPGLHLRVAEDFTVEPKGFDQEKTGMISAMLARRCGISRFGIDLTFPDHTGSVFVSLDAVPGGQVNCLIREARIHDLTVAVTRGQSTEAIECMDGRPARFRAPGSGYDDSWIDCDLVDRSGTTPNSKSGK